MSKSQHKVATAVTILCWLIDQHASDPGLVMLKEERPSNDTRAAWLRGRKASWLAIDTSGSELHALHAAGFVAQRKCQPSLLKVTARHVRAVAHPSYRLTDLGRCWCVSLLESYGDAANATHDAMLLAAMERPTDLLKLAAEVTAIAVSNEHQTFALLPAASPDPALAASWMALRLLGAGVRPQPGADPHVRAILFAETLRGASPPYRCTFCGSPSWIDPSDQTPPPDICHDADHGRPEETA